MSISCPNHASTNGNRPSNQRLFLSIVFAVFLLATFGCRFFPQGSEYSEFVTTGLEVGKLPSTSAPLAGPVSFQIVLPPKAGGGTDLREKVLASVVSNNLAAASVSFHLTLIDPGTPDNPTKTISRTVLVNPASGTAEVVFSGLPARTCVGEIEIFGGNIGGFREFQGMEDLDATASNTLFLAPKDSGMLDDVMVRVTRRAVSDATVLAKLPTWLAEWLRLMLRDSDLKATNVIDAALTRLRASLEEGFPLETSLSSRSVALPPGSSLSTGTLKVVTPFSEAVVGADGTASLSTLERLATDTAMLEVCENPAGNAVLLRMQDASGVDPTRAMSVETTAEALILLDPFLGRLTAAQLGQARQAIRDHAGFPALLTAVRTAIVEHPDDPFDPEAQTSLYESASRIGADVLATVLPPASIRRAEVAGRGPNMTVDGEALQLANNSYCHYSGTIWKNNTRWNDVLSSRRSLFSGFWASGQVFLDKMVEWLASTGVMNPGPGDGLLNSQFDKQVGLSLADGVLGLVVTCAGLSKPPLNRDVIDLGATLALSWATLKASVTSNSLREGAGNFLKLALGSAQIMRRITVILFRSAKSSWAKTILRAMYKKLLVAVTLGQVAYESVELVLIIKSLAQDPDVVVTRAFQREGFFPVGDIKKIDLEKSAITIKPEETFDLSNIGTRITYKPVVRSLTMPDGSQTSETLAEEVVRLYTKTAKAFPVLSTVSWTSPEVSGTVFTAPIEEGDYFVKCTYQEGAGANLQEAETDLKVTVFERFTLGTDKVITDKLTGLQWYGLAGSSLDATDFYPFRTLVSQVTAASGGWRLATVAELKTLVPDARKTTSFFNYWGSSVSGDFKDTDNPATGWDETTVWSVNLDTGAQSYDYAVSTTPSHWFYEALLVRPRR